MNKLELLRTFVRVTELSSFTQAGESLGLPRSTVSEHVQALEELLGARLLQRTTRKVQATQDGRVLYERSKDLLAHMEELEGLVSPGRSATERAHPGGHAQRDGAGTDPAALVRSSWTRTR